jgi:hypothetical protein
MSLTANIFKSPRESAWTRERLDRLGRQELINLQANAARLGETELAALCERQLKERPRHGAGGREATARVKGRHKLLPRSRAFGARGVWLQDPRTSWSGVRKADGMVVIALWHAAVQTTDGACRCLLWAPNVGGTRPWSDSAAGRERFEHCKLAVGRGAAEGLLVHGEPLEGRLPEDRARTVLGIDADTVIPLRVELRGREYWACWGKKERAGSEAWRQPPGS